MMKKSFIFYMILVLFLPQIGCKNNSQDPFNFPVTYNLAGHPVYNVPLGNRVSRFEVIDTMLLVIDRSNANGKILQFLSLKNFNYVASAGMMGKGPGEIENPAAPVYDSKNRILWLPDWNRLIIWKFPMDSILNNENYHPTYSFPIPPSIFPLMNLILYNDSIFAFRGIGNTLISFINTKGNIIEGMSIQNHFDNSIWDNSTVLDVPFIFSFFNKKKKILIVMRDKNVFYITDDRGNLIKKVTGPKVPDNAKHSGVEQYRSFYQTFINDKYFYFFYLGRGLGYMSKETHKLVLNYPNIFFMMDHKGNPVAKLILDHQLAFSCYDKKNRRIIGYPWNSDASLVYYDIPKLE